MAVHKVVSRCPYRGKQVDKKIYENDLKFELYGKPLAKGRQFRNNVEVYRMEEDEYKLLYTLKMPITDKEITDYVTEEGMYYKEAEWRIRDLKKEIQYFKEVHNKELK